MLQNLQAIQNAYPKTVTKWKNLIKHIRLNQFKHHEDFFFKNNRSYTPPTVPHPGFVENGWSDT